jgi:predicted ATPase
MLTRLRLERFKNFRDTTLELGPLTLLVGTNASGKSNLRDAFRFLHGVSRGYTLAEIIGEKWGEGGVLQWRGIRGGTREATFQAASTFALEIAFTLPDKTGRQQHGVYRIEVAVGDSDQPPRLVAERLRVSGEAIFDSHPANDPLLKEKYDPEHLPIRLKKGGKQRRFGKRMNCLNTRPALTQVIENPNSPVFVRDAAKLALRALESMRFLELDPEALRRPSLPGQVVLGDKGENLSSVLQSICTKPELKKTLASWITELTPMDAADFEFRADQTGRILVTLVEKNGQKISAYSASDGTLRFLAMIAVLLGPEPFRFYFFEELDNGIHPARLHLLVDLIERQMTQTAIQIVATTHSPELLALLSKDSLQYAALVYRLLEHNEAWIKRILDIPDAKRVIEEQDLARLHASGWLEDAVAFAHVQEEAA